MRNHRSMGAGTRRRVLTTLFASVVAVGGIMLPALPAAAVTCVVNGTANATESQIQTLLNPGGPSTVSFAGDCVGSNFMIGRNVTLLGSTGATVHGDGGPVFWLIGSPIVTFRNLHITGGSFEAGGGILIEGGSVTVDRVLFTDNEAYYGGAVYAGPASVLRVINSTFRDNEGEAGGAIGGSAAEVSVSGSTFTGNFGIIGGAVYVDASGSFTIFDDVCAGSPGATISRSTFTANEAIYGGAIATNSTDLTLSGSTFSRQEGAFIGGAVAALDTCEIEPLLDIATSTFTSNIGGFAAEIGPFALGGAVFAAGIGNLSVSASRFTGNRSGIGGALFAGTFGEYIGDMDGPFSDDNTDVTISGSTFTGNVADLEGGAVAIGADPEEEPTESLISTSTFTGNSALYNGGAMFALNTPVDVIGSTFTRNRADSIGAIDGFDQSLGGGAIAFASTELFPIMGMGPDAVGPSSIGPKVVFETQLDMDITRSRFISNSSGGFGGAVAGIGQYGFVNLTGSTFTGNQAAQSGGAAFISYANVMVRGSTFSSNVAEDDGGAIAMDAWFGYGDGPDYAGGLATDRATRFVNNRAGWGGGAISAEGADVAFSGVATGNSAGHIGGAIGFYDGDGCEGDLNLEISAATIDRNTAVDEGGGVWFLGSCGADLLIYDRAASSNGDAIGTLSEGPVSISYNRVTSNAEGVGGGILIWSVDDFFIETYFDRPGTITIQRNSAVNDGGGIFVDGWDSMYLDYGLRVASNTYGGVYVCGGPPVNATLTGNIGYGIFC